MQEKNLQKYIMQEEKELCAVFEVRVLVQIHAF